MASLTPNTANEQLNEQITLFRNVVAPMGVDPHAVEHDRTTGL